MKRVLAFLGGLFIVGAPLVVFGADSFLGPIVPDSLYDEGPYLRACDLVTLFDNIVKFAVYFTVFVATLMFAYAGFLYVTASAGKNNIDQAHKIFGNVLLGLFWVLAAWLVVSIIMNVLANQSVFRGPWNQIQCVDYPESKYKPPQSGGVTGGTSSDGTLVTVEGFACKNPDSCKVSPGTNLALNQMKAALGDAASEYQITETGVGQTVEHKSGSGNLDMSCFGKCTAAQVKAAVDAFPGRVVYETNSESDAAAMRLAGVPAANIKVISGTFNSSGVCSAGVGKCITAPHMSLYPRN